MWSCPLRSQIQLGAVVDFATLTTTSSDSGSLIVGIEWNRLLTVEYIARRIPVYSNRDGEGEREREREDMRE